MNKKSIYVKSYSLAAIYIAMLSIGMLLATKFILAISSLPSVLKTSDMAIYNAAFGVLGITIFVICLVSSVKLLIALSRSLTLWGLLFGKILLVAFLTGFSGGIVASSIRGFMAFLYLKN